MSMRQLIWRLGLAAAMASLACVPGAMAQEVDSDGDGLSDAWERGVGRYEIVQAPTTNGWTWYEAKADAEARGGHLATITSEAEWMAVTNMFGTNLWHCWLGGTDEEGEGVWKWVTGEQWKYSCWALNEPNNTNTGIENYLEGSYYASPLLWNDRAGAINNPRYLLEYGYYTNPQNADTDGDGISDSEEYELGWDPNLNDRNGTGNRVVLVEASQRTRGEGLVDIEYEIEGHAADEEWLEVELVADAIVNGRAIRIGALGGEVSAAAGAHRMTWDSGVDWPGLDAGNVVIRLSLVPKAESGTWYVSPAGDDEADGRCWATAKKTLQTAVELAVDGERILVAPGTYGPIVTSNKNIIVQGVGGAEETILDGGGSERVADNGGTKPVLSGLTLQHGYVPPASSNHGGGALYGTLHSCIIRDNEAGDDGGGVWGSICHNCLITGNFANDIGKHQSGGGACLSTLYNCTVVGNRCANSSDSKWGAGIASCRVYNCIVWDNYRDNGTLNNCALSTNLFTCTTPAVSGAGNITNNPVFVDAAHGNYRLATNSPCLNKGSNGYVSVQTDLAGNQRNVGGVDMGAYECGAAVGCSTVKVPSEFSVSEGRSSVFGVYTQDSDGDGLYDAWERGEGRYEIVEFLGTWEEAKADAEARGGHLATITSEAEWLVISNMYGTNVLSCWLGGSDAEEENVWKWVTGEPWKYTRWLSGQPDNYSNGQNYLWMNPDAHTRWGDAGTPGGRTGLYLFEYGYYTDPLNADTDGDGVEDGEEYELGRSPVVNEAEGTANEVVSVECRQRWPWNGLVDIDYEIGGWGTNEEELVVVLRGTATIGEETIELKTVTGEVSAVAGRHRMTWDSAADWGGEGIAEATVRLEIITPYLSVDMIGGANAANWPITRMKEAPEFGWTTDDKTTRLIMRRIEAGRYLMGGQYDVTISRPFYMGVFEVTQREWELAMGSNPAQYKGDARPVEMVNYNMIRGTGRGAWWPNLGPSGQSPSCVDPGCFMQTMRDKTGVMMDLPTEAQWEYACRAGTTSDYNNGGNTEEDLRLLGRYSGNQTDGNGGYSQHTMVGSYLPNAWGLYDMHGNVWEFCLDWFGDVPSGGIDPKGPTSGTKRVDRGGSWNYDASYCVISGYRGRYPPAGTGDNHHGLRLAAPAGTQSAVSSEAFTLDGRAGKGETFAGTVGVGIDGITWSGEWADGVAGGTAVVKEEGTALWEAEGEGEFTWTPLTAGTRVLTHEVVGTEGGRFTATFEVAKGVQTILFPSLGVQWATNVVELGAVAGSGLPVGYEVVSGPGVVEDGLLTFTGPGTVTVRASQAGDGNWEAAPSVTSVATVRAVPTVLVLGDLEQVYDGEGHGVSVETEPAGVAVAVTYDGGAEEPVHAGDYAVVAVTDDGRYTGRAEGTLHVAKAEQGIEFPAVGSPRWTESVVPAAVAGSGLPVGYAVASGPGRLADGVLSFTGPGVVSVVASQAGNADWEAAEPVVQEIVVRKGAAVVSFADLSQVYDGVAKQVSVMTTPSGLGVDVTYGGEAALPVGAGRYAVAATVVDEKWEGSGEAVLVVSKGSQSIEFGEIGAQVATNTVVLEAEASTGMAVKFGVLSGPGKVEGNVLTFTGAGTVTVMALQEGDANWAQATALRSFEVSKAVAEVSLGGLAQVHDGTGRVVEVETVPEGLPVRVTYDDSEEAPVAAGSYAVAAVVDDARWDGSATGTLVVSKGSQSIAFEEIGEQIATNTVTLGAVASSGLGVAYTVEGPAEVSGNVLTFTGAGTVMVTASQGGDGNWEAAEPVSVSFGVAKAVAEVTLGGLSQLYDGGAKEVEVSTVPEGLSVAVTYDGSAEAPVEAGEYAVAAVVEDAIWEGSAEGTLVITGGAQTIDFPAIGNQVATNTVTLGAVASSGLEVAYTVEGPAAVSGNVLTFTGAGEVTVTATQEGNENWTAAEPVSVSFDVAKAVAEVSLENLEQTFNGEAREAGVSTVPEGLAVAVTYDGSEVAPVNSGEYAVAAVVEDALWEGSAEGTLVIAKGAQSIEFPEIGPQGVTNRVELGATASSGLAVEYAVEGPALLEGAVLTFTGVGTVTVTAKQEGDGNWEAAADVVRAFEVSKGRATVTLEMLEQEYDGAAKVVEVATVPEGLEVAVTYDGAEAAPVDAGRYAVVVTVVDDAWEGSATGMLTVSKGRQSIDFAEIGSCGVAERLDLEAEASSGLAVTFAVLSGPAILEGGASLRFAETGTVTVAAMQFGDDNWLPAETVRQEFAVVKSVAQVSLEGLAQTFDGTEKSVSVETVPEGLAVVVTYDGAEEAPVDAGSYGVSAVVVDGKWEGSAEGVLSIAKGQQVIVFPEVGEQVATNVVELAAEASSGLPVGYEVVSGPGVLEGRYLSFTGVGTVVVQASQEGDANWEAAEAVSIEIEVGGRLVLTVESAHGVAVPEVGEHEVTIGTVVEAGVSGSPVEIGEGRRAVCTGWRLEGNEPEAGEGTVARFALTNSAVLTWVWETQALVQVEGLAHGTAEGGGWYALGQTATLTAVPEDGHRFTGWEGIVPGGQAGANPVELTVRGPGVAVATFFTTYYAREDGDDAGDGLSWATAKREIASALAEAARGDAVVASNGTYGAVSVPEGVSVRSVEGAEATVIRGGAGVRCVEAAAGAVVEGFSLEGGDVEGDGGGAWLADGAELRRCILRGNKAGGVGGGAYGGTLENCLVSKNAAAQGGGGAAGAELRHCTVVRSTGGGAKDCRAVNCVFWENEGGDVEGGATSWSLCNPVAAGAGNIEGDPCFAGEAGWKLAYESPCIDAAADSAVRVDLDGAPRPQPKVYGEELRPDMGCYEYVPKARFVWEKGSGTPPYESWADAARDIQSALDVSGSGDRVVVEAGTYGAVTVSNAVILMGYRGAAETVIDGRGSERAVTMSGGGTLVGFTVRGGASEDCGGILADGGATVRDVVVEGCRATGAEGVGGGLCLYGGSTAENVTASGNAAAYGGGVWAAETSAVVRCELRGNEASAWGGGAWLGDGSRMEGSVLAENSAVRGAGAYGTDCEIDWCEMIGNIAAGAGGGAAVDGGLFRNNRLSGNRASGGGGLYAKDTDGHDCLVTGNEAGRGAGVWMEGTGQLWNFTVADNAGSGAGVAAGGTTVLGNSIVWGNAGGNLDVEGAAEVRYSCVEPVPEGEGNFAEAPAFVGDGDYHLRAGSPCVDAGEVQEWMASAYDLDGQQRVKAGEEVDGRDIWVDIGADEAALDAVEMPSAGRPFWTWRVVLDANLRLQRAAGLLEGTVWEDVDEPFTATEQTWTVDEPFDGTGARFYRLIWRKE